MMPMGQSQLGWSSGFSRIQENLDSRGQSLRLGAPYSQSLSLRELWEQSALVEPRLKVLETLAHSENIDLNSTALETDFDVAQEELRMHGHWSYGLTSGWMIGVRVPIIYRQTRVRAQANKTPFFDQFSKNLGKQHPDLALALENQIGSAAIRKLESLGYEPFEEETRDFLLGDTELLSKTRIFEGSKVTWGLRQRLALPTSSAPRPYQFIESEAGDGQVDLGVDNLVDYQLTSRVFVTHQFGYTYQVPDQRKMRLQTGSDSIVLESGVRRELGQIFSTALFVEYEWSSSLSLLSGYTYRFKNEDRYFGDADPAIYQTLSRGSSQELHMSHLGLGYQFKNADLSPVQTNLYVSSVLAGRGVANTTLAQLDLLFYY